MNGQTNSLPCALCCRLLQQRADKNNKPYFVCDDCGTQFFVRGANGRERLVALMECPRAKVSKRSMQTLEIDLGHLQALIETFCDDEQFIPPGSKEIEDAVSFVEWSRRVCQNAITQMKHYCKER